MPLRSREWRVRLNDIIEAAERAISYTDTHTFEQFAAEPRTVDAVSYAIVIIGEAAGHIPDRVTSAAPEVPWADIRGMRNKVAHEYFGVDLKILWRRCGTTCRCSYRRCARLQPVAT